MLRKMLAAQQERQLRRRNREQGSEGERGRERASSEKGEIIVS